MLYIYWVKGYGVDKCTYDEEGSIMFLW